MYSKKRISKMSDAALMSAYSEARSEVYRLYSKDPDLIHIGAYTDAQDAMVRTLRLMVKRGFYRPTSGQGHILDENMKMKNAVTAKIEYRCWDGVFEGEADIRRYAKVLRRAHPEFESRYAVEPDDGFSPDEEIEYSICGNIVEPGMGPDGTGIGTITITFSDGTYVVHHMSGYPKGTRDLLISIVKWSSEGGEQP